MRLLLSADGTAAVCGAVADAKAVAAPGRTAALGPGLRPEVGDGLNALLLRMMAKRPGAFPDPVAGGGGAAALLHGGRRRPDGPGGGDRGGVPASSSASLLRPTSGANLLGGKLRQPVAPGGGEPRLPAAETVTPACNCWTTGVHPIRLGLAVRSADPPSLLRIGTTPPMRPAMPSRPFLAAAALLALTLPASAMNRCLTPNRSPNKATSPPRWSRASTST